jgi:hypothetical protein
MEFFLILVFIVFQSVFGIGLLLFGTPTLLVFGYTFPETLSLLLPISISISLFQFFFSSKKDFRFIKKFNIFCLPSLIISIYFILNIYEQFDFKLFISIIITLITLVSFFYKKLKIKNEHTIFYLVTIGIIHGISNLGGTLLSILSVSLNRNDKVLSRFFISYGYLTMAISQYIVLFFMDELILNYKNFLYLAFVILIYFPTQFLFKNINTSKFNNWIYFTALIYGIMIFYNSLNFN